MADPLSISASLVALITAAVTSIKALHGTVSRFKGRDKTLGRLQNELDETITILESLNEIVHAEAAMAELLQGPIDRCSKICDEFRTSMETFNGKSKTGFRDWTKLEFMRGDINEFIDTISGYKSTISVGLGTITIRLAKVSQKTIQEYNEMVQDTMYNLKVHLQRVDERMGRYTTDSVNEQTSSVNLSDEKEVTQLCLQICEDARRYLESLIKRESQVLQEPEKDFEAPQLTYQTLDENRDSFAKVIAHLRNRLESLVSKDDPSDEKERLRLMEDINTSKQCIEVCKVASEVSTRKIYRVGEAIADGDSDQVVVTTLADLFDVKKALSKGTSVQLVGSMADETLRHVAEKRYSSRFGAVPSNSNPTQAPNGSASVVENNKGKNVLPKQVDHMDESPTPITSHRGLSSNEVRKRGGVDSPQ